MFAADRALTSQFGGWGYGGVGFGWILKGVPTQFFYQRTLGMVSIACKVTSSSKHACQTIEQFKQYFIGMLYGM